MTARNLPKWLHQIAEWFGYRICDNPDRRGLELLPIADFRTCDGCGKPYHKSWTDPDYLELGPCCTGAD